MTINGLTLSELRCSVSSCRKHARLGNYANSVSQIQVSKDIVISVILNLERELKQNVANKKESKTFSKRMGKWKGLASEIEGEISLLRDLQNELLGGWGRPGEAADSPVLRERDRGDNGRRSREEFKSSSADNDNDSEGGFWAGGGDREQSRDNDEMKNGDGGLYKDPDVWAPPTPDPSRNSNSSNSRIIRTNTD